MATFRLLGLMRILRLVMRLMLDRRVPLRLKLIIPLGLLYFVSPLDILPDIIPLLGHVDDIIVVITALAVFLATAGRHVLLNQARGHGVHAQHDEAARQSGENVIEGTYRHIADEPKQPSS